MEDIIEKDFLEKNFLGDNRENMKEQNTSIVNFSFIWNLFEKNIFWKNIWSKWRESNLMIKKEFNSNFIEILIWVRNRYDTYPNKLEELFLRDKRWQDELNLMINNKNKIVDRTNIIWLLARVYKLRNNYFHWAKDIEIEENKLFKHANHFMIICLNSN